MDVFDLFAKLGLDSSEYESGLNRARGLASTVGGAIGAGVTAIAGVTTAAVGAAATGVVNLTTRAVNSYSEYEQMVGGIGKIFGTAGQSLDEYRASLGETDLSLEEIEQQYHSLEATQQLVLDNANNAWRTAGLGVNEYMSTVTTLSGALLGSLDNNSQLAAQYADRAIGDMSDIANTYGYTMDEVSQIYTSVSRGLYQTIDTLTAGQFAGTKSGYQELIDTMASMTEIQERLNITVEEGNYDYDNFVNAMSVYNEYMGIAGTTTNEAMSTIQGSMAMLKSTWQNLITGLGDENADLGSLIDNVVTSALAVVDNIAPVAEQALGGIAQLIDGLAPILEERLPSLIENTLPALLSAVTSIITAVASALPSIASVLLPQISSVVQQTLPAILSIVPQFISIGGEILGAVIQGLVENAGQIAEAGLGILQTLIDGFAEATSGEGISQLIDTTMQIVEMIGTFLVENAPTLITAAVQLITQLAMMLTDPTNLQMLIDMALQLAVAIGDGLVQSAPALGNAVVAVIGNLLIALWNELPNILLTIGELLGQIAIMVIGLVGGLMGDSYDEVMSKLTAIWDSVGQSLTDFAVGLALWIVGIGESISGMWTNIVSFFTDGIVNVGEALSGWWDEISGWFSNLASSALTWAGDMIDNFISGIRNGISAVGDAVSGIADTVAGYIGFSEPEDPRSALHNFHTFAPDMIDLWNETLEDSIPSLSVGMGSMSDYVADNMPSPEEAGEISANMSGTPIVVQAYFGNEKFDEYVVDSNQRMAFISGGR